VSGRQLNSAKKARILTVFNDCTHDCLALVADTSLSSVRVARDWIG
jgi:putative transposase